MTETSRLPTVLVQRIMRIEMELSLVTGADQQIPTNERIMISPQTGNWNQISTISHWLSFMFCLTFYHSNPLSHSFLIEYFIRPGLHSLCFLIKCWSCLSWRGNETFIQCLMKCLISDLTQEAKCKKKDRFRRQTLDIDQN